MNERVQIQGRHDVTTKLIRNKNTSSRSPIIGGRKKEARREDCERQIMGTAVPMIYIGVRNWNLPRPFFVKRQGRPLLRNGSLERYRDPCFVWFYFYYSTY